MLFSGLPFLYFFLPITLILYFIAPKKWKNTILLVASLAFYAWGERRIVLLFCLSIFLGWLFGLAIAHWRDKSRAKLLLAASVVINLGMLGYFKYYDFFMGGINALLGTRIPLLYIALPIGISFYTFQILSYTVDVYRGDVPAQKNLIDFATYVSFFPQLIAGPIVRYSDMKDRLKVRSHTLDGIAWGLRRFLIGLGKKVLFSNAFGELCSVYRESGDPSVLFCWLYAVAFTLQIYFDFSGYSDMAIGLGKVFGFKLPENFNYPYISGSITEFWRRWHMTLGSWFRDYVYIPLGGNRVGKWRHLFNILIVWMLTGLWHGAAWNFVAWGLFYAVLLMVEKLWLKDYLERHRIFGHLYVLLSVMLGFVLFNAVDFTQAGRDIAGMFGFGGLKVWSGEALYYLRSYGLTLILGILGATPLPGKVMAILTGNKYCDSVLQILEPIGLIAILLVVTAYLVDGSFNPFLYFRF